MGSFTNITKHQQMTTNFIKDFKKKLDNPFYMFGDKRPTPVTYFNINPNYSSLDQGTKVQYSDLGENSPLRYDKIQGFFIYGIGNMDVNADFGDYGIESADISGEAYVLPNTIVPSPQDFFTIDYLDQDILFHVTSVSPDTLPNGNNYYKLSYKLYHTDNREGDIEDLVVRKLITNIDNYGTGYKVVIDEDEYSFYENFMTLVGKLKEYYISMFYRDPIQTFAFRGPNGGDFYDPYMIEFIKRNDILKSDDKYLYIDHATKVNPMFNIEYDKTVFRALELNDKDRLKRFNRLFCGILVDDPTSILRTRLENYYEMRYNHIVDSTLIHQFSVIEPEVFERIMDNIKFEDDDKKIHNIIIRYFNNEDIQYNIANILDFTEYRRTKEMFYTMPIVIFIMMSYINEFMSDGKIDTSSNSKI